MKHLDDLNHEIRNALLSIKAAVISLSKKVDHTNDAILAIETINDSCIRIEKAIKNLDISCRKSCKR